MSNSLEDKPQTSFGVTPEQAIQRMEDALKTVAQGAHGEGNAMGHHSTAHNPHIKGSSQISNDMKNNGIPKITDDVRELCAGDASHPDATAEIIARARTKHIPLAQDVPATISPAARLLKASLAMTPQGIKTAREWGEALGSKQGAITPESVAASKATGPREQG